MSNDRYQRFRAIFSIKRILLSVFLGFLLPLSYSFILSLVSDYTRQTVPELLVVPFGWPLNVWDFVTGDRPPHANIAARLIVWIIGNILLYGSIVYVGLTMVAYSRKKSGGQEPPA